MLSIRKAKPEDVPCIMTIYGAAQNFMIENGNPNQWAHVYPSEELIREDIRREVLYAVCEGDAIHGVFMAFIGEEPTYRYIENGCWPDDEPYTTMHRVAGDGTVRGIVRAVTEYLKSWGGNIRADTHADNIPMQGALEKCGFKRCGTIYVEDGSPRIAYELPVETG